MDPTLTNTSAVTYIPLSSPLRPHTKKTSLLSCIGIRTVDRAHSLSNNGAVSRSCSNRASSSSADDIGRRTRFCYDKDIPEEIIEKPVGLSLEEKVIGDNSPCRDCQAKGAVLCCTCSGSGLYVDSIMESQGIIVKIRCLGCGGTGNIMCSGCGGRGHLGH